MKKREPKKLTLGRQTLRPLNSAELGRAAGGSYYPGDTADFCSSDSSEPGSGGGGGGTFIGPYP